MGLKADCGGLTEDQVQEYWAKGFLVFDNILSEKEVEELREACEHSRITSLRSQRDYETMTVHSLGITALHPSFLKLARHPAIVAKLIPLLGPDIELQHSKLATKPPTKGIGAFAWHQDLAFYPHTNSDLLSVMVMLDDATPANGCMQMITGSHKRGMLNHALNGWFTGACQEKALWETPDNPDDIVHITPKTGGISIHHSLTLHGSDVNLSGKPRRGLVFSYRACDAHQFADTLFDDTGLIVAGSNKGVVRCDIGSVVLPRLRGDRPYGSTWNQRGPFAEQCNRELGLD